MLAIETDEIEFFEESVCFEVLFFERVYICLQSFSDSDFGGGQLLFKDDFLFFPFLNFFL